MQDDWDDIVSKCMSGEMNIDQAVQMLSGNIPIYDANEERSLEFLEKFLFEDDDKALFWAQHYSTRLLINSLEKGSIYHDNVIGLRDVISFMANDKNFIKNSTIAGFEYGTSNISKEDDGVHILGWRNQRSRWDQRIKELPQRVFQDSVFHYNANLTVPFPPAKVGTYLNNTDILIESDLDTVTTPAGKFGNCLRLKKLEPESRHAEIPDVPITKIGWYALEVGMVKFQVIQGESVKEFQLLEYDPPRIRTNSYFPMNIGIKWVYEWQSTRFLCREISRPVDRAPSGKEGMFIHFGTSYTLHQP
jgi:hypothetical protein